MKKVNCIFCDGYGCCYCDHTGKVDETDVCYLTSLQDKNKFEEQQIETCIENSKFKEMGFKHNPMG